MLKKNVYRETYTVPSNKKPIPAWRLLKDLIEDAENELKMSEKLPGFV